VVAGQHAVRRAGAVEDAVRAPGAVHLLVGAVLRDVAERRGEDDVLVRPVRDDPAQRIVERLRVARLPPVQALRVRDDREREARTGRVDRRRAVRRTLRVGGRRDGGERGGEQEGGDRAANALR
jgi:hypothetical protein